MNSIFSKVNLEKPVFYKNNVSFDLKVELNKHDGIMGNVYNNLVQKAFLNVIYVKNFKLWNFIQKDMASFRDFATFSGGRNKKYFVVFKNNKELILDRVLYRTFEKEQKKMELSTSVDDFLGIILFDSIEDNKLTDDFPIESSVLYSVNGGECLDLSVLSVKDTKDTLPSVKSFFELNISHGLDGTYILTELDLFNLAIRDSRYNSFFSNRGYLKGGLAIDGFSFLRRRRVEREDRKVFDDISGEGYKNIFDTHFSDKKNTIIKDVFFDDTERINDGVYQYGVDYSFKDPFYESLRKNYEKINTLYSRMNMFFQDLFRFNKDGASDLLIRNEKNKQRYFLFLKLVDEIVWYFNKERLSEKFYQVEYFNTHVSDAFMEFLVSCIREIEKYGDFHLDARNHYSSVGDVVLKGVFWYNGEYFDSGYNRNGVLYSSPGWRLDSIMLGDIAPTHFKFSNSVVESENISEKDFYDFIFSNNVFSRKSFGESTVKSVESRRLYKKDSVIDKSSVVLKYIRELGLNVLPVENNKSFPLTSGIDKMSDLGANLTSRGDPVVVSADNKENINKVDASPLFFLLDQARSFSFKKYIIQNKPAISFVKTKSNKLVLDKNNLVKSKLQVRDGEKWVDVDERLPKGVYVARFEEIEDSDIFQYNKYRFLVI